MAFVLFSTLGLFGCTQVNEAVFLLPADYRGEVLILFDQESGSIEKNENGKRVYKIPDNGVLLTQASRRKGINQYEYYFVNSTGERQKINSIWDIESVDSFEGVYVSQLIAGNKIYPQNSCRVNFLAFRILSSDSLDGDGRNLMQEILPDKYPIDHKWQCSSTFAF